ncbi:AraC family transcriptional regulator [Pontibacillus halophilus JSM 076056 = DSM 19796]|uniref:AraC family transcriptional regulator n=1 Tax=Pontibacillus halophilus JSM 076056 = DSM 19796 TaxID=1385510 RepID=A0A0A5GGG7_9BACI|nr:solute:sodium symporter family transporter [Pontibacillus halophilus]KGX92341.1 AraC family transcriptional regulator [Pontibacillus halophilus JSM 076056 = DSM 19796]
MSGITYTLLTCVLFMGLVGFISYKKSKGSVNDSDGYFLAGRGLTGGFIAGSLLLTNLSAEQLIGLNGQAYRTNLSNMAWEVTAPLAVIVMALILLPKYLGGAFSTLPEFLSSRFDDGVRRYIVLLFMLGYAFVTIPSVLYSGALAVLKLFDVPSLLGISFESSVWLVIWVIGIIGAIYAIFGGLKAVAISDTLNGIGLLVIGMIIPIVGLIALGDGSLTEGFKTLTTENADKLNAIGGPNDSVPFSAIFTGMIFMNMFYWGTNQYVIQRALGAKNLAEGQKGVLFSGFYKLMVPILMMIPGVIAFHLYGSGLATVDLAYPTMVTNLMPALLSGIFLAVLLGAVFSSFNSLLNSAATMFALDVYKPGFKPNATDEQLIKVSKWFGTILALVSFFISPMLMNAPDGLWDIIRKFTGFFNIPIIAIVLVGIASKFIPPLGAKIAVIFHVVTYYMLVWGLNQLFGIEITMNFIHISAILFVIEVGIMIVVGIIRPLPEAYTFRDNPKVDMVPWKFAIPTAIILLSLIVFSYIVFSPIGLAYENAIVSGWFFGGTAILAAVTGLALWFSMKKWDRKYEQVVEQRYNEL